MTPRTFLSLVLLLLGLVGPAYGADGPSRTFELADGTQIEGVLEGLDNYFAHVRDAEGLLHAIVRGDLVAVDGEAPDGLEAPTLAEPEWRREDDEQLLDSLETLEKMKSVAGSTTATVAPSLILGLVGIGATTPGGTVPGLQAASIALTTGAVAGAAIGTGVVFDLANKPPSLRRHYAAGLALGAAGGVLIATASATFHLARPHGFLWIFDIAMIPVGAGLTIAGVSTLGILAKVAEDFVPRTARRRVAIMPMASVGSERSVFGVTGAF